MYESRNCVDTGSIWQSSACKAAHRNAKDMEIAAFVRVRA